jgi:hypothetical protein
MKNYKIYNQKLNCFFEGQYDNLDIISNGNKNNLIKVSVTNFEKILDINGKLIIDDNYSSISKLEQGDSINYFIVYKKNKFGYIKDDGSKITECIFDEFSQYHDKRFKNGLALVVEKGIKKFIKEDGSDFMVVETSVAYGFDNGLALLKKGRFYGFLDTTGQDVSGFVYSNAFRFTEKNFGFVSLDGKWGVIDNKNNILVDFKYDDIESFTTSQSAQTKMLIKVKSGKLFGIIDIKKKTSTDIFYKDIQYCGDDLFVVKRDKKWGIVNFNDEEIIPFDYDEITVINKVGLFKKSSKYKLIDLEDGFKELFKGESFCFFNPFISIKNKNHIYILNTESKNIYQINLNLNIDNVVSIKNSYLVCQSNGNSGVIDFKGNLILEFNFVKINIEVDSSDKTYFIAEYDKLKAVYGENGKKIVNQMYDYIDLRSDCFIVHNDKKCRIFSLNGNDIVGDVFDHVYWTSLNGESYLIAVSSVDLDKN